MLSWVKKSLFFIHIIVILGLVLSWSAPTISPQRIEWISVVGIGFPYLMITNIVFTFYWLIQRKWQMIPGIIMIALGWNTVLNFVQFNQHEKEHDLRVMSFNIRSFNKYGWKPNKDIKTDIADFIKKEDIEILCLQEFYDIPASAKYNTTEIIKNITGCKNFFMENYYNHHKILGRRFFGLAIFSKHKIINGNVVFQLKGEKKARAIYVDIQHGQDTLRVYNLHLRSIRFKKEDYQFLKDVTEGTHEEKLNKSRTIIQKLERAFHLRSIEAEEIRKHMDRSPHPYLVMGDFNEAPNTYGYRVISDQNKDGFIERGKGFGLSYEGKGMLFSQRIDYIISSPEFDFQSFTTHSDVDLSDHKPVSATLNLKL